jgi:hypothetical protein
LPATIAQSGIYCLTSDLAYQPADGNAISINANDVVLDLNGHKLDNLKAGAGTVAAGIFASQRRNVVVKNGTIRGFSRAIFINDSSPYMKSQGWVIEDIRADRSTYAGMVIWGRDCLLRRNVVAATGGSTAYGPNADAVGIVLVGASHRVIDNDVITVTKQGTGSATAIAFGIQTDGSIAVANRVWGHLVGHFRQVPRQPDDRRCDPLRRRHRRWE